jgi:hypothetical protein
LLMMMRSLMVEVVFVSILMIFIVNK